MARDDSTAIDTKGTFSSINPANGGVVWEGKASSTKEIDSAVQAARSALSDWAALSIEERCVYIRAYGKLLEEHRDTMAEAISQEMGKPRWEAQTELSGMISKIAISEKAQAERCPEKNQQLAHGHSYTRHKPHGVLAVFGPFNFPGHLPNGHIVPALIAGNTIVFKPSELTPLVGEKMCALWMEAGLPPGVLNLVQGSSPAGKALAQHSQIDGLLFTGSAQTGQVLSKQFATHPQKILALELGGNNPLVVGEISDLKAAAYQIVQSAYATSGQRCTCARRLILPEGPLGDSLLEELTTWISRLRVGPHDSDPQVFMGPVVSWESAQGLLAAQDGLIKMGAQAILEMRSLKKGTGFLSPGLIDVSKVSDLPDTEYFGPLLQVIRVHSFDAAIEEANRTAYGLSAGLFSDNPAQYARFYREIRAGIINWNTQTTGASSAAPFGGTGISGNHRPSAYYAADYCNYPVASMENKELKLPSKLAPGID